MGRHLKGLSLLDLAKSKCVYSSDQVLHSFGSGGLIRNEELIKWLDDNMKGDYGYNVQGRFYFSDEEDALLFKLTWG